MKLILAHDYLIQMGGAERVVSVMHKAFPAAPIYTSAICRKTCWQEFRTADVRTSWMQYLPGITHHTHFKKYFPLYPLAFQSMKIEEAEAAWISSSTFAKFLRPPPGMRTVGYLHNTTRFLWQTNDYVKHEVRLRPLNRFVRLLLPALREADRAAAANLDVVIANSRTVQERIREHYGREAVVIHPPVDAGKFSLSPSDEGFYLIVSRLLGYKGIDLPVRLFTKTGRRLVILGEGPDEERLRSLAGKSVEFRGRVSDEEIRSYYSRCRAMILPGEEDFGITPLEAMASGKPVIALGRGGALESVVDGRTGVFFQEFEADSLIDAIERCEGISWDAAAIRSHAMGFSTEAFVQKTSALLFPQ